MKLLLNERTKRSPNKGSFSFLGEDGMNDVAISIITKYIEENFFDPQLNWPKEEFDKRSYSKWAAYEILESVMDKPFTIPIEVIDEFYLKMAMFNYAADGTNQEFLFKCATDTAEEIALLFV